MTQSSSSSASANRRELSFHCFNCLRGELDRIEAACRNDPSSLDATGNWTPAQILQHLADAMKGSFDGFAFRAPWLGGTLGPLVRRMALRRPAIPSGIQLKGAAKAAIPPEDASFDDALASLRREINRADDERMTANHPFFGKMTQANWTTFHLRHAELHLGFISFSEPSAE